ncbi:hypothetical protein CNQ87_17400 [Lysinibacillus fusiformis]|uniref:hypothetical protein n=1 Tax=Lysinibacillus fusiformis TaxID=28031 RepID=UPI000BBAB688|nr:hypothetical protein [Lysinibacillus fusiformis]PCD82362.1 hypothetical protein CNQ87_17400 [Lysinibacillus fusiformis]
MISFFAWATCAFTICAEWYGQYGERTESKQTWMLGSKMSYALFIEDYLILYDANAPIKENFDAAVSFINPVRKVKKGEEGH